MKKELKKLVAGVATAMALALPLSIGTSGVGQVQEAKAYTSSSIEDKYYSIEHILRTFKYYHLDNHGYVKSEFLDNRGNFVKFDPTFDRFLRQCAQRDQDKFWEYFKEKYSLPILRPSIPNPVFPG